MTEELKKQGIADDAAVAETVEEAGATPGLDEAAKAAEREARRQALYEENERAEDERARAEAERMRDVDDEDEDEHGHGYGHDHGHEGEHEHHHGHGHSHSHEGAPVLSIIRSAISHTVQVSVFIFLVTLILVAVLETFGESAIEQFLRGNETLAVLGSALVGLIPNCSASVVITQLYLEGALQLAPMLAGTLISAGVGYLVLFRTNRSARENAVFLVMMYVIGAGWGLVLSAFGL